PVDLQCLLANEARLAFEDRGIGLSMAPLLACWGQWVDALPDPPEDTVPVEVLDPGGDSKQRSSVDRLRHISGVDEHLGRNAPTVQAGAAKFVLLDDGNRPASMVWARDRIPGACPNNNQVELLHHTLPALRCVEKSSAGALPAPLQQCHWRANGESPALDHGAPETLQGTATALGCT